MLMLFDVGAFADRGAEASPVIQQFPWHSIDFKASRSLHVLVAFPKRGDRDPFPCDNAFDLDAGATFTHIGLISLHYSDG